MGRFFQTFLATAAFYTAVQAQIAEVTEYEIKAAYLFNFAKFVDWPAETFADSTEPIIIAILGKDPFGKVLGETVSGKTVKGRKLVVERYKKIQDLHFCHILFISTSKRQRLAKILRQTKNQSILTVSELKNFIQAGGVIRLFNRGNKVRFDINLEAAKQAQLRISSRVLNLAENLRLQTNGRNKL